MTSACLLRKGLFDTFVACGPFSPTQVSTCDYRIIEQNSTCAIIIHLASESIEPITYRGANNAPTYYDVTKFNGECYIAFGGDPTKFLSDVYQAHDDIESTLKKDSRLQSSACLAWVSEFKFNIDEGYNMGGRDWGVLRFVVNIHDL